MKTGRFSAKTVWAVAVAIVLGGVAYAGLRLLKAEKMSAPTARSASNGRREAAERHMEPKRRGEAPRSEETSWRDEVEDCFRHWPSEGLKPLLARVWACSDGEARAARIHAVAEASVSASVLLSGNEATRSDLARDYLFCVLMPIAGALGREGVPESEFSDYVFNAWKAYRSLCGSFDPDSGERGAKRRALTAKRDYADGCAQFDRVLLEVLFRWMPEGAEARFRARWKSAFRPEPTDADAGAKSR